MYDKGLGTRHQIGGSCPLPAPHVATYLAHRALGGVLSTDLIFEGVFVYLLLLTTMDMQYMS